MSKGTLVELFSRSHNNKNVQDLRDMPDFDTFEQVELPEDSQMNIYFAYEYCEFFLGVKFDKQDQLSYRSKFPNGLSYKIVRLKIAEDRYIDWLIVFDTSLHGGFS